MRLTSLTLFLMTLTGLTIMSRHVTNRLTLKTCRAKRTQDLNLDSTWNMTLFAASWYVAASAALLMLERIAQILTIPADQETILEWRTVMTAVGACTLAQYYWLFHRETAYQLETQQGRSEMAKAIQATIETSIPRIDSAQWKKIDTGAQKAVLSAYQSCRLLRSTGLVLGGVTAGIAIAAAINAAPETFVWYMRVWTSLTTFVLALTTVGFWLASESISQSAYRHFTIQMNAPEPMARALDRARKSTVLGESD